MHINRKRPAIIMIYIISLLVIPASLTLLSVIEPGHMLVESENPTPYGYTISLGLFLIPGAALAWWFFHKPDLLMQKKAFRLTMMLLIPAGIVLDILFGNAFFSFLNHDAVLGITLPAVGGDIPIEEFIFYISGFATVLLIYIWCDEYWLEKYNVPDYQVETAHVKKILQFHAPSLYIGLALIAAAIIYKKIFSGEAGFPWYFVYLTIVALTPSMALYKSAKNFINWRAFSLTFVVIVLISLLWEVTLALPYAWWGFQHQNMLGLYIDAWFGLPIEEIVVWFSVSYATVIVYEVLKIWLTGQKKFKQAFWGE